MKGTFKTKQMFNYLKNCTIIIKYLKIFYNFNHIGVELSIT